MEREGEVEMRRGRRRGGEKMRGIIVGGMVLSLLLGCNNGVAELEKKNENILSISNLKNGFLDVFATFGDMVVSSLGLNANMKKNDVKTFFDNIALKLGSVKEKLNLIKGNANIKSDGVEKQITTLVDNKIEKIIAGAKKVSVAIGDGANDEVGKVVNGSSISAKPTGVDQIIMGIKEIVDIVLKTEGNHQAGTDNKAEDGNARAKNTGAAHLFIKLDTSSDAKKAAADASKAVGAVYGEDILKAIHSEPKVKELAENDDAANAPAAATAKDALIAGALAVRGMAKDGKFATAAGGTTAKAEINNAVASAIKMALNTLNIAIMRTIDVDLKAIKDAMKLDSVASGTAALK